MNVKAVSAGILILGFSLHSAVVVDIDWETSRGKVPPHMYSLNLWDGFKPSVGTDAEYQRLIADMHLSMARYHGWEMIKKGHKKCWIDYEKKIWDEKKIRSALSGLQGKIGEVIMNIPGYPDFIDSADAYARFCADLVEIINIRQKRAVKYWEPYNERQDAWGASKSNRIFTKCAEAMKKVDPTIKVGGPAVNQPWWDGVASFLKECKKNIDFVTYHQYCRGDTRGLSAQDAIDCAKSRGGNTDVIRKQMNAAGMSEVPLFCGEANITWTWDKDPEGKMQTRIGALYDATLFKHAVEKGAAQSIQLWNDRDNAYGKLNSDNTANPGYYVLKWLSRGFYGTRVGYKSSNARIGVFAVRGENGARGIMIINGSSSDQKVDISFTGWNPSSAAYDMYKVRDRHESSSGTWSGSSKSFPVRGESILFLIFRGNGGSTGALIPMHEASRRLYPEAGIATGVDAGLLPRGGRRGGLALYDSFGRRIVRESPRFPGPWFMHFLREESARH